MSRFGMSLCVLLALLLSGCVAVLVESASEIQIENPVPHKAGGMGGPPSRWACQPERQSIPVKKADYVAKWGLPARTATNPDGETWFYETRGRWCGVWVVVLLPVPLLLPVCDTSDAIQFQGDNAVRSTSRRLDTAGAGLVLVIPVSVRHASATENGPGIMSPKIFQPDSIACPEL